MPFSGRSPFRGAARPQIADPLTARHGRALGCFHLSAVVTKARANVLVRLCVSVSVFGSPGHVFRRGISGSRGNFVFSFLRKHQAVFHGDPAILRARQSARGLVSPHPRERLLLSVLTLVLL